MSETILNEAEWAEYSAARLKAVWVDFAEAAPEQRAQYLKEELSRAIKPIPGGYRKNYLGRLRMKFPAFAPAAAPARAEPADDTTPVETAPYAELVQALLLRIGAMKADEKADLARQLGPVLPFPKPAPVAAPAPAGHAKDREALEAALNNFAMLENLGWRIWKEMAPQGEVKKEGDLSNQSMDYFRGKNEVLPQLKETMVRNRMVIGALLMAIPGGLQKYANDFYGTFSPDYITAAFGTSEKKCWSEYVKLAKQDFPIAQAISFKIRGYIGQYAEGVMKKS